MDRQTVRLVTKTRNAISFTSTHAAPDQRHDPAQLFAEESDDLSRAAAMMPDRPPIDPTSTPPCDAEAPAGAAKTVLALLRDFWRAIERT